MGEQHAEIEACKAQLLAHRRALVDVDATGKAAGQTVELDQSRVGRLSRMDALQAQAMSQATDARRQHELHDIDAALARIEDGSYGECLECGEPIPPARLRANPAVRYCIDCASATEQRLR